MIQLAIAAAILSVAGIWGATKYDYGTKEIVFAFGTAIGIMALAIFLVMMPVHYYQCHRDLNQIETTRATIGAIRAERLGADANAIELSKLMERAAIERDVIDTNKKLADLKYDLESWFFGALTPEEVRTTKYLK